MEKQEGLQWSPPTRRQERIRSLTTGRHTVGGAPPPKVFSAQAQDGSEEWFLSGLTCALIVRKCRGLSRQIWRAYQDRSINALVYHPQRTASSRLRVYTNIELQDATPRIKDSVGTHEGSDNPQDNKSCPRSLDSSRSQFASWTPSNSQKNIFSSILDILTPLTLKMSRWGFDRILSATSTPQLSTLANEDDLHLWQKQVFDATQIITGELEEKPLRPNSNLVSTPL
jgi:hypothetical protein